MRCRPQGAPGNRNSDSCSKQHTRVPNEPPGVTLTRELEAPNWVDVGERHPILIHPGSPTHSRTCGAYTLMSEEHGPNELVDIARRAEEVGFDFLVASDHFHPWVPEQQHSPYAWSVLGAVAAVTERVELATLVTCPIMRYHPAVVAQKAATMALLSGGRFRLCVGTGERLNQHVVGQGWPSVDERHDMLAEAIEIMRLLWEGGYHSYRGEYFDVEDARVFDLPDDPVPTAVAAGGPRAAALAGRTR